MYKVTVIPKDAILGMKKTNICCIIFAISICISSCTKTGLLITDSAGNYDISAIEQDIVYSLKGTWGYAEQEFISPYCSIDCYHRFESITDSWTLYSPKQNVYGYASYAVKIRGFHTEKVYAIHFPSASSAITAFFNGKKFYESGIPGHSIETETCEWKTDTAILPINDSTEGTLVIHISNFHDRNPGIETPFLMGSYETVLMKKAFDKLISSGIFAVLLTMATFFISLFFFYRKDTPACLFGLLCFSFAIRTLCYNDFLLLDFFPDISSRIMFRLGYVTFPICAVFTFLFIFDLFIKKTPKILYILTSPLLIYATMSIFTPFRVFTKWLVVFQLYTIFLSAIACGVVIYAIIKRKPFAVLFLISFSLFIGAASFDVLISNGMISALFISHFAVLLLLVPMAFIVIRHFSRAFKAQEQLIGTIEKTNISFQRFFPNAFMQALKRKKVTDIALGDNTTMDMFVAFIHIGIQTDLKTAHARKALLNAYNDIVQIINPLIEKSNGFIDKYLPEGLMVLFTGSAEEAVNCIIDITMNMQAINLHRKEMELSAFHIFSGIHHGKVMMGAIGVKERMDTTVLSDTVNVSSRMHSYAMQKEIPILISETVRSQLPETYWRTHTCFYHGKIRFYGKRNLTNVYEVNML